MSVMTNDQPIIGAYGDIYTAPVGTPPPALADWDDPTGWTLLGTISADGATWTPPAEDTTEISTWQSMYPERTVTTGLSSSLAFALDSWDRVTVPFALGGGKFDDTSPDIVIYKPPGPGESVSKALFLKVIDGDVKLGLYFPKGRVTGRDDTSFKKDEAALLNVTFGLEGSRTYDPYQLIFDPASFPPAGGSVVATGATAGVPGSFTPSGATPPADLAAMTAITATPATAWTTGQYVVRADTGATDQGRTHWDSTDWVTGVAP
jgi:hypothetical protein